MHHNVIAVYDDHDQAVAAVTALIDQGFKSKHISLLGKAQADDPLQIKTATTAAKGIAIGAISGPVLGVLTGLGVMAIPGFGFLYGAGALVGALAGLDIGTIGGSIAAVLLLNNEESEIASIYDNYLLSGKILLVYKGTEEDNSRVAEILKDTAGAESVQQH